MDEPEVELKDIKSIVMVIKRCIERLQNAKGNIISNNEIRELKNKIKDKIDRYLLKNTKNGNGVNGRPLECEIDKILDVAMTLFQADTSSIWLARDDFVTKGGQRAKRIVFLKGKGAYTSLEDQNVLNEIMNDPNLGEYPNYKFYGVGPDKEKSGTSYVGTHGIQIFDVPSDNLSGIELTSIQQERSGEMVNHLQERTEEEKPGKQKRGKYDKYIWGEKRGQETAYDYVVIQPLIFYRYVIGVLKVEKRKNPNNTNEGLHHNMDLFRSFLDILNQNQPTMAGVLDKNKELIEVMEYGSPGIGFAINLEQLGNHKITMNFVKEYHKWLKVFKWAKNDLEDFKNEVIDSIIRIEGKNLVSYSPEPRIKTISSIVEKIIRHKAEGRLDKSFPSKKIFIYFKDLIGLRMIFRFREDREIFYKRFEQILGDSGKWSLADLSRLDAMNKIPEHKEEPNPRDTTMKTNESGYRAIHCWIEQKVPQHILRQAGIIKDDNENKMLSCEKGNTLGEGEKEFKIIAEIQMRTLLEDAWAQKAHSMLYKEKWSSGASDQFIQLAHVSLEQTSNQLRSIETTTDKIKSIINIEQ